MNKIKIALSVLFIFIILGMLAFTFANDWRITWDKTEEEQVILERQRLVKVETVLLVELDYLKNEIERKINKYNEKKRWHQCAIEKQKLFGAMASLETVQSFNCPESEKIKISF